MFKPNMMHQKRMQIRYAVMSDKIYIDAGRDGSLSMTGQSCKLWDKKSYMYRLPSLAYNDRQ